MAKSIPDPAERERRAKQSERDRLASAKPIMELSGPKKHDTGVFLGIVGVLAVPLVFVLQANGVVEIGWIPSFIIYVAVTTGFMVAYLNWRTPSQRRPLIRWGTLLSMLVVLGAISSVGVVKQYRREHPPRAAPEAKTHLEVPKAAEVAKAPKPTPAPPTTSDATKQLRRARRRSPELGVLVVTLDNYPAFYVRNISDGPVKSWSYRVAMWNLDAKPPHLIPARAFTSTGDEFIKAREGSGAYRFFDLAAEVNPANERDRLFGYIEVTCATCSARFQYILLLRYAVTGGWYAKLPEGQFINIRAVTAALTTMVDNPEQFLSGVKTEARMPILAVP